MKATESTSMWIKITEILTSFIRSIIWPFTILIIALYFGKPIKQKILDSDSLDIEASTSRISLRATKIATYIALADQRESDSSSDSISINEIEQSKQLTQKVSKIEKTVESILAMKTVDKLSETKILWVDDKPSKNLSMKSALEELDIKVITAFSTEEAMKEIESQSFDMIISDYWRPNEEAAGYNLLAELQKEYGKNIPPYILYAKSNTPEKHRREALNHGAYEYTNDPSELLQIVKEIVEK